MDPGLAAILESAMQAVESAHGTVLATWGRDEDTATVDLVLTQSAAFYLSADENISTRVNQTAFMVKPSQIDFGAGPQEPAPGDVVTFNLQAWTFVYTVCRGADNGPCFAPTDAFCTRLKVNAALKSKTPIA